MGIGFVGDREPRTTSLGGWYFCGGGGWCANCRNLRKRNNRHHPDSFALAMLIVDFVGVVRGFRSLSLAARSSFRAHDGSGTKIQPKVFLTEVFGNPLGSWTSAPSGHGSPRSNAVFFQDFGRRDRNFGLGHPREWPPDVRRMSVPKTSSLGWFFGPPPPRVAAVKKELYLVHCGTLRAQRLKKSISIEKINLDWNSQSRTFRIPPPPQKKIGVWWVSRLKISISIENFNPGGRSWIFSIFGPLGKMLLMIFRLVFSSLFGKNRISQGVEIRGSLISVPLALRENTLRAQRLKKINLDWKFQSCLKKISISIENFNPDLQNSPQKK